MEELKFRQDKEEYFTSQCRWVDYLYGNNEVQNLLRIGESVDYFYFSIIPKEGTIANRFVIDINKESGMFKPLSQLIKGFKYIEVMEEGTTEQKSLAFEMEDDNIHIIFNLTDEERVFNTIELANLRRHGDTRFRALVPIKKLKDEQMFELEFTFRYKFKQRLHSMMDELQTACKNNQINRSESK